MFIYFVVFGSILALWIILSGNGSSNKTKTEVFAFACFLIFFLFEAFRGISVGEDTINYVNWFETMGRFGWRRSFENLPFYVEPAYKVLNLIVYAISNSEQAIIIATSFMIIALHIFFLKKNSTNFFASILLFMGTNVFINTMTAFRQIIAMGIVFWMVPLIRDKKYARTIIVAFLAFMFHHSSIVYILCVIVFEFLGKSVKNIRRIFIVEIVSLAFIPTLLNAFLYVFPKYDIYFKHGEVAELGKLRFVYIVLDIVLLIYFYIHKELHNKENTIMALLLSVSAYIGILNNFIPHIFRLGYYFDYYLILFIPVLYPQDSYGKNALWKMGTLYGSLFLFAYYLTTNAGGVVPYKLF